MSKFIKQAKIKSRQADLWMEVCHVAMDLFPNDFKHPTAIDTMTYLLRELAAWRRSRLVDTLPSEDTVSDELDRLRQRINGLTEVARRNLKEEENVIEH